MLAAREANHNAKSKHLDNRQAALTDMENRAKFFVQLPTTLHTKEQVKKKMLLADPGLDLELTKKMNAVGFETKNDYNRERNQARPPVHKYSVIGDPLEYGMDFSLHKTETHEKYDTPRQLESPTRRRPRLPRDQRSAPSVLHDNHSDGIPANIRAKFGSRLIEELFADQNAVDLVKERLAKEREGRRRRHEKVNDELHNSPRSHVITMLLHYIYFTVGSS